MRASSWPATVLLLGAGTLGGPRAIFTQRVPIFPQPSQWQFLGRKYRLSIGAGEGNRTLVISLEGCRKTFARQPWVILLGSPKSPRNAPEYHPPNGPFAKTRTRLCPDRAPMKRPCRRVRTPPSSDSPKTAASRSWRCLKITSSPPRRCPPYRAELRAGTALDVPPIPPAAVLLRRAPVPTRRGSVFGAASTSAGGWSCRSGGKGSRRS